MKIINEIRSNIHGVVSLGLFGIAVLIGLFSIFGDNFFFGILYLIVILVAPFTICYFYCAKCTCKTVRCSHVFPGRLTRIFNLRKTKKYQFQDYLITVIMMLLLIAFPQFWLFHNIVLFVLFWISVIAAIVEVRFFVCVRCENKLCPLVKTNFTINK